MNRFISSWISNAGKYHLHLYRCISFSSYSVVHNLQLIIIHLFKYSIHSPSFPFHSFLFLFLSQFSRRYLHCQSSMPIAILRSYIQQILPHSSMTQVNITTFHSILFHLILLSDRSHSLIAMIDH